jgi:hypothetical protein
MKQAIIALALLFSQISSANPKQAFDPKGTNCLFVKFMTKFAQSEKGIPEINSFFVAEGVEHPEGEYWVYWPQKRKILLVGWPAEDCRSPILLIRKQIDLTKDVVKSESDVGGSTYLVTEDWARKTVYDAAKSGYQISVKK